MSREMLNLRSAAEHVHMDANELRHVAQRGEIDFSEHGGDLWFEHRALDEWAQRNLLASGHREQIRQHNVILEEQRRSNSADWRVWRLFAPTGIVLGVPGKAKAGILRDMTSIADATGFVYDPDALFKELVAREETASTAVGEGAAFCTRVSTTRTCSRRLSSRTGAANARCSSARQTDRARGTSSSSARPTTRCTSTYSRALRSWRMPPSSCRYSTRRQTRSRS